MLTHAHSNIELIIITLLSDQSPRSRAIYFVGLSHHLTTPNGLASLQLLLWHQGSPSNVVEHSCPEQAVLLQVSFQPLLMCLQLRAPAAVCMQSRHEQLHGSCGHGGIFVAHLAQFRLLLISAVLGTVGLLLLTHSSK